MKNESIYRKLYLILAVVIGSTGVTFAETGDSKTTEQEVKLNVAASAMIALWDSAGTLKNPPISMTLSGLSEAGAEIQLESTNANTRLRISSITKEGESRKISAQLDKNITSTQNELYVTLTNPGDFEPASINGGETTDVQRLTDGTAKDLITNIKGYCWSGTDPGDGYVVEYLLQPSENATDAQDVQVTVTYTITGA